jgi:hypothetical protein
MILRVIYLTFNLNKKVILFKRSGIDFGHSAHVCHRSRKKESSQEIRAKSCNLLSKEVNKNLDYITHESLTPLDRDRIR